MQEQKLFLIIVPFFIFTTCFTGFCETSLPEKKQTALGLYLTALEAFTIWHMAPSSVKVLDVRTPGEYLFVGHAPMAANIPALF